MSTRRFSTWYPAGLLRPVWGPLNRCLPLLALLQSSPTDEEEEANVGLLPPQQKTAEDGDLLPNANGEEDGDLLPNANGEEDGDLLPHANREDGEGCFPPSQGNTIFAANSDPHPLIDGPINDEGEGPLLPSLGDVIDANCFAEQFLEDADNVRLPLHREDGDESPLPLQKRAESHNFLPEIGDSEGDSQHASTEVFAAEILHKDESLPKTGVVGSLLPVGRAIDLHAEIDVEDDKSKINYAFFVNAFSWIFNPFRPRVKMKAELLLLQLLKCFLNPGAASLLAEATINRCASKARRVCHLKGNTLYSGAVHVYHVIPTKHAITINYNVMAENEIFTAPDVADETSSHADCGFVAFATFPLQAVVKNVHVKHDKADFAMPYLDAADQNALMPTHDLDIVFNEDVIIIMLSLDDIVVLYTSMAIKDLVQLAGMALLLEYASAKVSKDSQAYSPHFPPRLRGSSGDQACGKQSNKNEEKLMKMRLLGFTNQIVQLLEMYITKDLLDPG